MSAPSLGKATFLWPAWSRIVDGRIVTKITGYEAGNHWTSEQPVGLENEPFWSWFYANRHILPPIMSASFLPKLREFWVREFSSSELIQGALTPPSDGNYISRKNLAPSGKEALDVAFRRYGENAFTAIPDVEQGNLTMRLLALFCRGLGEVFCYRNGRCDYYAALGEVQEELSQQLALLDKRIRQCQSS